MRERLASTKRLGPDPVAFPAFPLGLTFCCYLQWFCTKTEQQQRFVKMSIFNDFQEIMLKPSVFTAKSALARALVDLGFPRPPEGTCQKRANVAGFSAILS